MFESLDLDDPRKSKGWFSKRQPTSAGLEAYREDKERKVSYWRFTMTMTENAKERAERSPQQQIALLDRRLGKGKGAVKERKRLTAQVARKNKGKGKPKKQPS